MRERCWLLTECIILMTRCTTGDAERRRSYSKKEGASLIGEEKGCQTATSHLPDRTWRTLGRQADGRRRPNHVVGCSWTLALETMMRPSKLPSGNEFVSKSFSIAFKRKGKKKKKKGAKTDIAQLEATPSDEAHMCLLHPLPTPNAHRSLCIVGERH
ncbi:hypothetical protein GE21DRAFT_1021220 [Neurospora crassa]|nr:hypothetical protein GE21DRAFT_1021220 [Neurospora crassa]